MKKNFWHRGFTLVELFVTVGVIALVSFFAFTNFLGGKSSADLNSATSQVVASVRQAQSQAAVQSQNAIWGIHFANTTNTQPYYALFTGSSYASGTVQGRYVLPPTVGYVTSTLPAGSSVDVTFSGVTGASSASTSIGLYLISNPSIQQNIAISGLGQVSYSSGSGSGASGAASIVVWIGDRSNNRVEGFDSNGNYVRQIGICSSGHCMNTTTSGGFTDLLGDVTVDSSGNIWVIDDAQLRVEEFNSAGTYIKQLGCASGVCNAPGTNGGFAPAPSGVAVDASGNIWVTDPGDNRMQKFNSSGAFVSQLGCASGACPGTSTSGGFQNDFGSITIDSSGNLWVVDGGAALFAGPENQRVEEFSSAGSYIKQLGCASGACGASATNGKFDNPYGVAVDASGNIWVADAGNHRVEKFNSSGTYVSQLGCASGACAISSSSGKFYNPSTITIDSSGNLWIGDPFYNRVEEFTSGGSYIKQIGICASGACTATSTNGGFNWPAYNWDFSCQNGAFCSD